VDAISLLMQDHRTVDQLFERFEGSTDPAERRQLVDRMIEELSVHAAIEEQELYPLMRRVFPDGEPVEHAEHEHAEAKALLAVLAKLEATDERFETLVSELIDDVRHHVEEEESDLFPQMRDAVADAELAELGERLERAKSGAPTKPSAEELKVLTQSELYEFAQKAGIEGRSEMSKDDLAAALAS
jgi:hemerythrin-like domain-containing protein